MVSQPPYIGRFAPSPTGPLHLGSLATALISYLDARAHSGQWLIRIDDLDTPRNQAGAIDSILNTLEGFGLHWDGNVDYQSRHHEYYEEFLAQLQKLDLVYRCYCSRSQLGAEIRIYPGYCKNKIIFSDQPYALRLKTDQTPVRFVDRLQGEQCQKLAQEQGDFILKRKDKIIAYTFAVVVDDWLEHVNQVVRGCDLLLETPKQIYLHQCLQLAVPSYMHVPVLVDDKGHKLSKQTLAKPVVPDQSHLILFNLLILLKQQPPACLYGSPISELLDWAIDNWQPSALQHSQFLSAPP